jgi:hypothetical protein
MRGKTLITILENVDDEGKIGLGDGSRLQIWPFDIDIAILWTPSDEIEVQEVQNQDYTHVLINRSNGQRARALATAG